MARPLNPKQLKFIERYQETKGNATQSYIDAFGKMERRVAEAAASRLLSSVKVKTALDAVRNKAVAKAELTAEWVLDRLKSELTAEDATQAGRIRAVELIGRHLGMFEERPANTAAGDLLADLLRAAIQRRISERPREGRFTLVPVRQPSGIRPSGPPAPVDDSPASGSGG